MTAAGASSERAGGGMMRKGFWAIMDQGLFSGSNLLVNVLLANWLSPVEFGAFSVAFAAFLLLGVIHTSLLTEPMLVLAPDRYKGKLSDYLGALTRGHFAISILAGLSLLIAGLICQSRAQHELAVAFYCFAATGPFTLYLWLMRRACYAQFNPARAAHAGMGYLVLTLAGLIVLHHLGRASTPWATALMGLSSLIIGLFLALNKGTVNFGRLPGAFIADVTRAHWDYGKWSTGTAMLGYVDGNIYYFLLPMVGSLAQSGALSALTKLFSPFVQANAALCLLLLPAFVRQRGTAQGRKTHRMALLILAGGPLAYWLVLGIFRHPIIHLIYHGKYDGYANLMWVLGFQPVIAGMCGVYGSLLRAHQKMNGVFWGGVVAAVGALTVGVAMTRAFGMWGVCWSIVITYALHHLTLWLFSRDIKLGFQKADAASTTDLALNEARQMAAVEMQLAPS